MAAYAGFSQTKQSIGKIDMSLPQHQDIDVVKLSAIFNHTTEPYKFLFFRSLINQINRDCNKQLAYQINLKSLGIDMARQAWWLGEYYKLWLGKNNELSKILTKITFELKNKKPTSKNFENQLIELIAHKFDELSMGSILQRYVPYRLLSPFCNIPPDTPDAKRNNLIKNDLHELFNTQFSAPYKFHESDEGQIVFHPEWYVYFQTHQKILIDWCNFHLAMHLQKRNPNVPAIISKILPIELRRSGLQKQKEFWDITFQHSNIRCIYSGQLISSADYDLDHFLPWSYVCHDELWNLIPVSKKANRAKSDSIPHDCYIEKLADVQFQGIQSAKRSKQSKDWENDMLAFTDGLKVSVESLDDYEQLYLAYRETIEPLATIAKRMGFDHGWQYK